MAIIIDRFQNYIQKYDDGTKQYEWLFDIPDSVYFETPTSFIITTRSFLNGGLDRLKLLGVNVVQKAEILFSEVNNGDFVDSNLTPWLLDDLRAFLRSITGGKGILYYNNITGWASYVDTQYPDNLNAFTVPATTDTILPNNAGVTIESQKPVDVETFYTGGRITGRDGDSIDLQIYFFAVPSVNDQVIDVWLDIGGAVGVIYTQSFGFPKGAGVERGILYAIPSGYTGSTWEANGAAIYVRSSNAFDLYGVTMNVDRSHKAVPTL